MAGKAGDGGHIRPERGTDVLDRAEPDAREPGVQEPDVQEPDAREPGTGADGRSAVADEPARLGKSAQAERSAIATGAPVFVDPSGRRAGRMRRAGWLVAAGCVCSAATLGLVVTDRDSSAPWLSIPGVVGTDHHDRGAKAVGEPERTESGAPAADSPATTAARPPTGQGTEATTGTEVMAGPRSQESGSGAPADGKSTAAPSAGANGTAGSGTGEGTQTPAGRPSPSSSPDTGEEPATQPGSEAPAPDTSADPAPAESSSPGLIGGLVDAVSGLFGR